MEAGWLIALVLVLGAGGWWLARRSGRRARPFRADEAARLRDRLIARVKDPNVADRLAEEELQREPSADMATCYQRALQKLERDKAR